MTRVTEIETEQQMFKHYKCFSLNNCLSPVEVKESVRLQTKYQAQIAQSVSGVFVTIIIILMNSSRQISKKGKTPNYT